MVEILWGASMNSSLWWVASTNSEVFEFPSFSVPYWTSNLVSWVVLVSTCSCAMLCSYEATCIEGWGSRVLDTWAFKCPLLPPSIELSLSVWVFLLYLFFLTVYLTFDGYKDLSRVDFLVLINIMLTILRKCLAITFVMTNDQAYVTKIYNVFIFNLYKESKTLSFYQNFVS